MLVDYIKTFQKTNSYKEAYALNFVMNSLGWFAVFGVIAIIFRILYRYTLKNVRRQSLHPQFELGQLEATADHDTLLKNNLNESIQYQSIADAKPPVQSSSTEGLPKAFKGVYSAFSWMAFFCFSTVPLWFGAFNMIPVSVATLLTFLILAIRLIENLVRHNPNRREGEGFGETLKGTYRRSPIKVLCGFITFAIIAVSMNLATYKSCVNGHVDAEHGIRFGKKGKFVYTSALTRMIKIAKPVCPPGEPCHVYATLPFDSATSVFLTVHTHPGLNEITLKYDTKDKHKANSGKLQHEIKSGHTITPSEYDKLGARSIHTALLTKLEADTLYVIEIIYDGKVQKTIEYATLPDEKSQKTFNLVYGGDLGISKHVYNVTDVAASQDPKAIIIGGDLAYDDGEAYCYYTLDLTLWLLETHIFQKLGRIVPFVLANGNHDVGFKSLVPIHPDATAEGPSYYSGFAQHYPQEHDLKKEAVAKVPQVQERRTYHAHMLGNLLHVVLDAGYVASYHGEQLEWLRAISEKYPNNPKVAVYHDPIYMPCVEKGSPRNEEQGMQFWVPVFDKNKYMVAFEHHAHMYKRSLPLRGGVYNKDGTIYLGNGDWGVKPDKCLATNETQVYGHYEPTNHVWVAQVNPALNSITYLPLNKKGKNVEKGVDIKQDMNVFKSGAAAPAAPVADTPATKEDNEL